MEKYRCDVCRTQTEAERWLRFSQLPPIFTIHLKRFSYTVAGHDKGLQQTKISFPMPAPSSIRFEDWCSRDCPDQKSVYGSSTF